MVAKTPLRTVVDWYLQTQDGSRFVLPQPCTQVLEVGRELSADVKLLDAGVSRYHATLSLENGELWVEDQHSENGTFVNSQRVTRSHLVEGDIVTFGRVHLTVHRTVEERSDEISWIDGQTESSAKRLLEIALTLTRPAPAARRIRSGLEQLRRNLDAQRACLHPVQVSMTEPGADAVLDESGSTPDLPSIVTSDDQRDRSALQPGRSRAREMQPALTALLTTQARELDGRSGRAAGGGEWERSGYGGSGDRLAGVAIEDEGRQLASLLVERPAARGAFTQKELELLEGFARLAEGSVSEFVDECTSERAAAARRRLRKTTRIHRADTLTLDASDFEEAELGGTEADVDDDAQ